MGAKFTIQGELADANAFIDAQRRHLHVGAKLKKEETERVMWEIKATYKGLIQVFPISITFSWYCKDKRKDKDNIAFAKKFILDGLVAAEILPDDGWAHVDSFTDKFFIDKNNPRVEVEML